jgi:hypothetical protein
MIPETAIAAFWNTVVLVGATRRDATELFATTRL